MKKTMLTNFTVDKSFNTIRVERTFSAPVNLVWSAWTEPQILDQWWAPKPYKTHTKSMDFREGGFWLYCMEGPEGDKHWCRADYKKINTFNSYEALDAFCNEQGELNQEFPRSLWQTNFSAQGDTTDVTVLLTYNSLEDLEKIVSLGFKEGFTKIGRAHV